MRLSLGNRPLDWALWGTGKHIHRFSNNKNGHIQKFNDADM